MANKTFTINGKTYLAKKFSYNTICDLQDLGIDVDKMGDRGASMTRAFFSIWSGLPLDVAGEEIGKHMMAGGSLDDLGDAISDCMENSDFFQYLTKTEEKAPQKSRAKKSEKED